MTPSAFLASLLPLIPRRKAEAAAQIDGAIQYDGIGTPPLTPEERAMLVRAKVLVLAGRSPVEP